MSTWNEGLEVRKKLLSLLHELLSAARSPEEKIVYPSNLIFHHPLVLLRHRKLLRHRRFHNWPSENTTLRPKDSPRFCSRANSQRRADYLWREIPTNPRSSGSSPDTDLTRYWFLVVHFLILILFYEIWFVSCQNICALIFLHLSYLKICFDLSLFFRILWIISSW